MKIKYLLYLSGLLLIAMLIGCGIPFTIVGDKKASMILVGRNEKNLFKAKTGVVIK